MNFKQLSKEKKNNLVLVGLLTAIALGGLGFGLIRFQYDYLQHVAEDRKNSEKKLHNMQESIRTAELTEARLAEAAKKLSVLEEGMASGDPYSWVFETMRRFKLSYKVEIPQFSQPVTADTTLLPKFPYKQVTIQIAGTGNYHDIGKFIADFENQFPHIRLLNLSLDPGAGALPEDRERLDFKMDIVALVRPNPS